MSRKMRQQAKARKDRKKYLVDGKYSIQDLVDLDELKVIFDKFAAITGATIGFLSYPDQELLVSSGWRDICTKFHRVSPASARACYKSNVSMTRKLDRPRRLVIEQCDNGLVDGGTPIIIKNKQIATLATGQVFFKKPEMERFRRQARKFGYDMNEYLQAVREVPVVNEKEFRLTLSYLGDLAMLITRLGYTSLAIKDKNLELKNEVAERRKVEERLREMALRDSHTGLYNHRYLQEALTAELSRARREGHPFSLLMIDIDYFKSINDVYGHQFGDLVLKQMGALLKRIVRRYDTVIRYGGEEFVILCPTTNMSKAIKLGQRTLDAINTHDFGNAKYVVKLKATVAISSYPEDTVTKGMDMVGIVDKVLNNAKDAGGNTVYSSMDLNGKRQDPSAGVPRVKSLKEKIEKLTKRGNQSVVEAIFAFAKTIEARDKYTRKHSERAVRYAEEIAKRLGLPFGEVENIKQACILHDLGKVGVPDQILQKPGFLTKKEFNEIKKHPQVGADIIRPIQSLHRIVPLILYHHEWWNGRGYPMGLKGREIPIGARIVAVAEVFEALTSARPYRKAFSVKKAVQMMEKAAGSQFDPNIIETFLEVLKEL